MKNLFMCLLLNLKRYGSITAANLYRDGKFANFEVENGDCVYTITITKEEKKNVD